MEGKQLALKLFEQLEEAARLPEDMSVSSLLQQLDRTLDGVPAAEKMPVAAEALSQIVTAFSERAELLLLDWEDRCRGPLVDDRWLDGLVERSPTFELAAYETEPIRLPSPPKQSRQHDPQRVRYITRDEALAALEPHIETVEHIVALAQPEEVGAIERRIWEELYQRCGRANLVELSRIFEEQDLLLMLLAVLISERLILHLSTDSFYAELDRISVATK